MRPLRIGDAPASRSDSHATRSHCYSPQAERRAEQVWSALLFFTPIAFFIGSALHGAVYASVQPAILFGTLVLAVAAFLSLILTSHRRVLQAFLWLACFYWLCAGLVTYFEGPTRIDWGSTVDAEKFYTFLASTNITWDIDELSRKIEGALAVLLWDGLYSLAMNLGIQHEPYIGISLNIIAMSLTGGLAVLMTRNYFGDDMRRTLRVVVLFAVYGIFLMFATHHIRDAYACLGITMLAYVSVAYLHRRSFLGVVIVIVASLSAGFPLYYLRAEFVFVPIAFAAAGLGSLFVAGDIRGSQRFAVNMAVFAGLLVIAGAIQVIGADMAETITRGNEAYSRFGEEGASQDSLGLRLVVNQPLPVRVIVGPPYVLFMPIPVWWGFVQGQSYHLFKSLAALLAYFLAPAMFATVMTMWRQPSNRTAPLAFLVAGFSGFLVVIGMTSAETRHMAAFVPLAIVASVALIDNPAYARTYRSALRFTLVLMAVLHMVWLVLKGS